MDLTPFVDQLRRDLLTAADAGGEEARALAERLTAPLESSVRLALLSALSQAAEEITGQLAPGAVDVRLRGSDLGFAVTHPPAEPPAGPAADAPAPEAAGPAVDLDEGGTLRITLRLPEQLKARVDDAAARLGVSVNTWLVRAVANAMEPSPRPPSDSRRAPVVRRLAVHRLGALAPARPHPHRHPGRPAGGTHPCPEEGAAMPTFDTPGPSRPASRSSSGSVRVRADDRHDTVVTVRPRNERSSADVAAAEQTLVTFSAGELLVRSTSRPRLLFFGSGPEIDVDVVLPAGSSVDVRTTAGEITCAGRLGAVGPGQQVRRPAPGTRRQPARPHLQRRHLRRRRRRRDRGDHVLRRRPRRRGRRPGPAGHRLRRRPRRPGPRLADRRPRSTARCASARRSAARWCSRPPTARSRPACARGRRPGSTSTPAPAASATCSPRPRDPRAPTRPSRSTPAPSYGDILIRRA